MHSKRQRIFIYGTLRRRGRAHHLMQGADFQEEAFILGRLVHVDEYPGLILCDDQQARGELYLVGEQLLNELDRYEGCYESPPHYLREDTMVTLKNGEEQAAQTYVFQLLEPHHEEIKGGDWIAWIDRQVIDSDS